jgi:DNA repair exonuclease SbcCD ATPase subunit
MQDTETTPTIEVLPPETTGAQSTEITIPHADQLAPSMLTNIRDGFAAAFAKADEWRQKAMSIKVTSADQTGDMKLARVARLELKAIRVEAEKVRKKLKEESLLMGRAIDGTNAILLAAIVPLETYLEEQENFAARLLAEQKARIIIERTAALAPYVTEGQALPPFDILTPEGFDQLLADYRLLHEAKIEAARKAEEERIAKEKAEAEARALREAEEAAERERVRLEMERLRAEATAAAIEAERLAAEREAERLAAEAERRKIEEEREAERLAAKAEADRIAAEREAERRKLEAERQKVEAEAAAKLRAQEALLKAEREAAAREAAAREAAREAERLAEAERIRLEKARIAAEAKAKADAEAKAARAPDKTKLKAFADQVRGLAVPTATTEDGKRVAAEIAHKVASFATWIETQTSSL